MPSRPRTAAVDTSAIETIIRLAKFYKKRLADLRTSIPRTMLTDQEIILIDMIAKSQANRVIRTAELGTFIGGSANLWCRNFKEGSILEVYDLFEHNITSRKQLKKHKLYNETDFFDIWQKNTGDYQDRIELYRGDINERKDDCSLPLDNVFVDIVKHKSVVDATFSFYKRLRVGGILLHQDYFHWQSPWIVYQMEALSEYFKFIGFVDFTTVYVKIKEFPAKDDVFSTISSLPSDQKYKLFDEAISRFGGLKAAELEVSKLRLAVEEGGLDVVAAVDDLRRRAKSPRLDRYLDGVLRLAADESKETSLW